MGREGGAFRMFEGVGEVWGEGNEFKSINPPHSAHPAPPTPPRTPRAADGGLLATSRGLGRRGGGGGGLEVEGFVA
jgi:hypothetical protein